MRLRAAGLVVLASALVLASSTRSAALPPPKPAANPPTDAQREEAKHRFEKGLSLLKDGALEAALAEFQASRTLAPTRGNTRNIAVVLRKLHRFDEALDAFETLARDFWDTTDDERDAIQREIEELKALVGSVEIRVKEPGAIVSIDGKDRGVLPVLPLRVSAGTHVVRIVREGRSPLETRVDVAGGQTAIVEGALVQVASLGRLRVVEATGAGLEVWVDGASVGVTPWEGPLSSGAHVVSLKGPAGTGTGPTPANVRPDVTSTLTLAATRLDSFVRIETEADAMISIDDAAVSKGIWEGALPSGSHRIDVHADGQSVVSRTVSLAVGAHDKLSISSRPSLAPPPRAGRFRLELSLGLPLSGRLGGDLGDQCNAACEASLSIGELARAGGFYVAPGGLALGLEAGYLHSASRLQNRHDTILPNGRPVAGGTADDRLSITAGMFGVAGDFGVGERFTIGGHLGAGVALGYVVDQRDGSYSEASGQVSASTSRRASASFAYVAPEVRVGFRAAAHLRVSAGLEVIGLAALHVPTRSSVQDEVLLSTRDFASYPDASLTSSLIISFIPVIAISGDL